VKLSRLYCNDDSLFGPVEFRDGLNVILGRVEHPRDQALVSHNIGKTLLLDVLDFALLKGIDQGHFLKRRPDLFDHLVFYLELSIAPGRYVTTRRSVAEPTKVSLACHDRPRDFDGELEPAWDHWRVPIDRAVRLLDGILELTPIRSYGYRKGISYFLRRQSDYDDVFRLSKFASGRDRDWKPFVARLLGLNDEVIRNKYDVDDRAKVLSDQAQARRGELGRKSSDYPKLKAQINAVRDEVGEKSRSLDEFDFRQEERRLAQEGAQAVEEEIATANVALYNCRHDLAQIERALDGDLQFDLREVRQVFNEARIAFPDQLARDYEALVEFNRRILADRRAALR
jgi:uncharacterized protein YydD (DUF2326 family)